MKADEGWCEEGQGDAHVKQLLEAKGVEVVVVPSASLEAGHALFGET